MYSRFRTALTALGLAAITATAAMAQAATPPSGPPPAVAKFAYVDSRVIVERAPGRAAAESTFQKEYEVAQNRIKRMQDTLQAMVAAYTKAKPTMAAVSQELREKEIRDKQQQFENTANLLDAQMQARQGELVQPIMVQIREVLEAIRKEDGYSFIFDVGTSNSPIVAADKAFEITEKVIGRLKPVPVTAAKGDSTKTQPLGARPQPSGVTKKPTL
jgi:outer membrane protein